MMEVAVIAVTTVIDIPAEAVATEFGADCFGPTDADVLAELAGRACYKSWNRPNPETATNAGYLANIIKQGHFSVLEHASVSFWVTGVSRALLLELERHRFLSFSVESQRYVDTAAHHAAPAVPPGFDNDRELEDKLQRHYNSSLMLYRSAYRRLMDMGYSRKAAREAARSYLPNATVVDFLVTGNLRAWRDVLGKRWHEAADAEMRMFADKVLARLRVYAPHSVADIPRVPYQ